MRIHDEKMHDASLCDGICSGAIEENNLLILRAIRLSQLADRRSMKRCLAVKPLSFGVTDYAVKPYVPRVCLDFLDFLTRECESDQFWSQPALFVF